MTCQPCEIDEELFGTGDTEPAPPPEGCEPGDGVGWPMPHDIAATCTGCQKDRAFPAELTEALELGSERCTCGGRIVHASAKAADGSEAICVECLRPLGNGYHYPRANGETCILCAGCRHCGTRVDLITDVDRERICIPCQRVQREGVIILTRAEMEDAEMSFERSMANWQRNRRIPRMRRGE